MSRNPQKIAEALTAAQARALTTAWEATRGVLKGGFYPRLSVRMDVRGRLQMLGLLSLRPGHGLTNLGLEVRKTLRGEP